MGEMGEEPGKMGRTGVLIHTVTATDASRAAAAERYLLFHDSPGPPHRHRTFVILAGSHCNIFVLATRPTLAPVQRSGEKASQEMAFRLEVPMESERPVQACLVRSATPEMYPVRWSSYKA